MKRRNFLKNTMPLVATPLFSNNLVASVLNPHSLKPETLSLLTLNTSRILIIINLFGGNDGLSTVYSNLSGTSGILQNKRSGVLSSMETESQTNITYNEKIQGLIDLKNNNKLAIIQGVGSWGNTGSHFASDDIFQMGLRDISSVEKEGLIGKYFIKANYTSSSSPLAIHVGGRTPRSFIATGTTTFNQYYTVSPNFSSQNTGFGLRTTQNCSYYQEELDFIQTMFNSTRDYNTKILDAFNTGNVNAGDYDTDKPSDLSSDAENFIKSMKLIATLIKGGLGAKIYTVNLYGFDTHTNQVTTHNMLLSALNYGISKFVNDLSNTNFANDVLGVTFSEFGRRITANGSTLNAGTDHGHSSPSFMFGCGNTMFNSNNNKILGCGGLFKEKLNGQPTIYTQNDINASTNTVIEHDYREVYSAIFQQWFGLPTPDLTDIIAVDGSVPNPFSHNNTNIGIIKNLLL